MTWSCFVPVVPVRMTEAWLLIDEGAIRRAASNPNGTQELELPAIARLEDLSDPKTALHDMLLKASEKRGRRLDQFRKRIPSAVHRVAELITDFRPLRQLDAFRAFEAALVRQAGRFQIGAGDSVS